MSMDWRAMNDNKLRAHLDSALAERQDCAALEDCSYSDEEFDAMTQEFRRRRIQLIGAQRSAFEPGAYSREH